MTKKIAVVVLNLGGPDKLSSVKEFLFNLFYDPAIIRLANPFRWLLAKLISSRREKTAKEIYSQMGGKSTILSATNKQAKSLEIELNKKLKDEFKVFVSMRYWHPFASEIAKKIKVYAPDEILLLPLYPQFSTTTTKSSLDEFSNLMKNFNLKTTCCYFKDPNFIKSHAELISKNLPKEKYRILFSAHGLPEKIIKQGDPYQYQVEETVKAVVKELAPKTDYVVCYQSKVGPLKWIGPSTEDELKKAAEENIAVVVVPIAFVSEHSETLVELDIEYKELFEEKCKKPYIRIPALNDSDLFIKSLFDQTKLMLDGKAKSSKNNLKIYSQTKCKGSFKDCLCK
ncbi:MAG: ferrochelatase [Rickettsiales bacterium]|jgi:ferrochelatase|nr:ferrochelatase [Rickettsiales bacterium]